MHRNKGFCTFPLNVIKLYQVTRHTILWYSDSIHFQKSFAYIVLFEIWKRNWTGTVIILKGLIRKHISVSVWMCFTPFYIVTIETGDLLIIGLIVSICGTIPQIETNLTDLTFSDDIKVFLSHFSFRFQTCDRHTAHVNRNFVQSVLLLWIQNNVEAKILG